MPEEVRSWLKQDITLDADTNPIMPAQCLGSLAVHRMLNDEGWTITYIPTGERMSCGYRVFATEAAAKQVVEELQAHYRDDWAWFFRRQPDFAQQAKFFIQAHDQAEARGDFLSVLVAPKGMLPPGVFLVVPKEK